MRSLPALDPASPFAGRRQGCIALVVVDGTRIDDGGDPSLREAPDGNDPASEPNHPSLATPQEEAIDKEARSTGVGEQLWALTAMNVFPLLAIGTALMSVMTCAEGARITSMSMGAATAALLIGRVLTQRALRAKARKVVQRQ